MTTDCLPPLSDMASPCISPGSFAQFLKYFPVYWLYMSFWFHWIINIIRTSILLGAGALLVWFKAWSFWSHASSVLITDCLERMKYMYISQISLGSKPWSTRENVLRWGFCARTNWRWCRGSRVINPSMDEVLIPWEEMDDYQSKHRFANTGSSRLWARELQEPRCTSAVTSF